MRAAPLSRREASNLRTLAAAIFKVQAWSRTFVVPKAKTSQFPGGL